MSNGKKESFKQWWGKVLKVHNYAKDPDDPRHYYDYRAAFKSGHKIPEKGGHWSSQYKHDLHPNRYIRENGKWSDTKYGESAGQEDVIMQKWARSEYEKRVFLGE